MVTVFAQAPGTLCRQKGAEKLHCTGNHPTMEPSETEFRGQEALPLKCSFTARWFMNTTKSTLILPHSELDFQVAKTDSDALLKLAELFFCIEEVILNRLSDGSHGKGREE